MAKKTSTRLENFSEAQLTALAGDYATIKHEVNKLARDGSTRIQLPDAVGRDQQLAVLRELEAKEDLWIRISYAGNLNVWVRQAPEVETEQNETTYIVVLRRPATEWCVPRGLYVPEGDSWQG